MAGLGLHCCVQAFSSCGERGLLSAAVLSLTVVASLDAEHRLQGTRAAVVTHRLSSCNLQALEHRLMSCCTQA